MSARPIDRLLVPKSVALVGGTWTDAVAKSCQTIGFAGPVWRIHPTRTSTAETHYYRSVDELPGVPDATFLAAPNRDVPEVAAALSRRGAGGFVCFAAGFSEIATPEGVRLTGELEKAAGELPFFGPNCYGFINFFDRVALWPDQVVGEPGLKRGVALICQSGTISLNLMFSQRSLPIGYLITVGNQQRLALEDLIELMCDDPRVTAFGLYVEGIQDPVRFARAVDKARAAGKPIALVKTGRTAAAARTTQSHTGALAGVDVVFDAYCREAGIARLDSLGALCETLKVLHAGGPLPGRRVLILGASGGDMAMTADTARDLGLEFPAIEPDSVGRLRDILSERVTIANPFDFHTYIWFDLPKLKALFSETARAGFDAVGFMVDCPPPEMTDPKSYYEAIDQFIEGAQGAPSRGAVISSLPESMAEVTRRACLSQGVVPLQGQRDALVALDAAGAIGEVWRSQRHVTLIRPATARTGAVRALTEAQGKEALARYGLRVPAARVVTPADVSATAAAVGFPVVLKAVGEHLQHKSEVGGVIVNVRSPDEAAAGAAKLATLSDRVLVEEMINDGVAEILVGVTVDAQFGQVLVLGAGGIMTELWHDTVTLLPPFTPAAIEAGLRRLTVWKLLEGFRGKPAGDVSALVEATLAITRYAADHVETLTELDVNPIIVRPAGRGAVAVDTLIRLVEGN